MDDVIALMEAIHRHLTVQKSFYVEISRARHRAELVTDDAGVLHECLEAATGERVSALEGLGVKTGKLAVWNHETAFPIAFLCYWQVNEHDDVVLWG